MILRTVYSANCKAGYKLIRKIQNEIFINTSFKILPFIAIKTIVLYTVY